MLLPALILIAGAFLSRFAWAHQRESAAATVVAASLLASLLALGQLG